MHIEYDDFGEYVEMMDYVINGDPTQEPYVTVELVVADYRRIKAESTSVKRSRDLGA